MPDTSSLNRRAFLHNCTQAAVAAGVCGAGLLNLPAAQAKPCKMTMDLVCGNIGVSASQAEAIELAAQHGFESVGADGAYLSGLNDTQLAELKQGMKSKGVGFGAAGLRWNFEKTTQVFLRD